MRNGRKTGSPVSTMRNQPLYSNLLPCYVKYAPGCSVESMVFFACHNSGVMFWILPCLYAETNSFACANPFEPVNNVLSAPTVALALKNSFHASCYPNWKFLVVPPCSNFQYASVDGHQSIKSFLQPDYYQQPLPVNRIWR